MLWIQTPALIVDFSVFDRNVQIMADALPGPRLRPHVKAHKSTELARRQMEAGHHHFTCATLAEMEGMARAGLGADLLLANEVVDASRLTVWLNAESVSLSRSTRPRPLRPPRRLTSPKC